MHDLGIAALDDTVVPPVDAFLVATRQHIGLELVDLVLVLPGNFELAVSPLDLDRLLPFRNDASIGLDLLVLIVADDHRIVRADRHVPALANAYGLSRIYEIVLVLDDVNVLAHFDRD